MRKLILTSLALVVAIPLGFGVTAESQEKVLETLKNRLASVEDRLNAMEELKSAQDPQIVSDLINIVRDSEDSIVVRGHVIELLITIKDSWAEMELKKLLNEPSLPSETRRMTLYGLWKKDPEAGVEF